MKQCNINYKASIIRSTTCLSIVSASAYRKANDRKSENIHVMDVQNKIRIKTLIKMKMILCLIVKSMKSSSYSTNYAINYIQIDIFRAHHLVWFTNRTIIKHLLSVSVVCFQFYIEAIKIWLNRMRIICRLHRNRYAFFVVASNYCLMVVVYSVKFTLIFFHSLFLSVSISMLLSWPQSILFL